MEDLKEIKSNIINWYDFKENSNILVIGNYLKEVIEKMPLKLSRIVYIDNFKCFRLCQKIFKARWNDSFVN